MTAYHRGRLHGSLAMALVLCVFVLDRGQVGEARVSTRSHRYTCHFHRPFKNAELALEHYRAQVSEGKADPGQTIYRCAHCRQWHHGGAGRPSLGRLMAEGQPA